MLTGHWMLTSGVVVLAGSLALSASRLCGQTAPPWSVALEAGNSEIHRPESTGAVVGVGMDRRFGAGLLRLQFRFRASRADEDYFSLGAGPEARLLPDRRLTPVVALHVGLLGEPEYGGWFAEVSGGLRLRLSSRLGLRGVLSRGTHGGATGPDSLLLGVEWGLGDVRQE